MPLPRSSLKRCCQRAGLCLTVTTAPLACGPAQPPAPVAVRQAEVRHCVADAPGLAALGFSLQVVASSETERTIRLTSTRDSPVHLESIHTHLGVAQCGYGASRCQLNVAARHVELAPKQSLDLVVDASMGEIPYPCTSAVLAVSVRISQYEQACSDVASWTAVREGEPGSSKGAD